MSFDKRDDWLEIDATFTKRFSVNNRISSSSVMGAEKLSFVIIIA